MLDNIQISNIDKPIIQIDRDAACIYIQFNKNKVEYTEERYDKEFLILADFDKNIELVGVEIVNYSEVKELFLNDVLSKAEIDGGNLNYKDVSWTLC